LSAGRQFAAVKLGLSCGRLAAEWPGERAATNDGLWARTLGADAATSAGEWVFPAVLSRIIMFYYGFIKVYYRLGAVLGLETV